MLTLKQVQQTLRGSKFRLCSKARRKRYKGQHNKIICVFDTSQNCHFEVSEANFRKYFVI